MTRFTYTANHVAAYLATTTTQQTRVMARTYLSPAYHFNACLAAFPYRDVAAPLFVCNRLTASEPSPPTARLLATLVILTIIIDK